MKQNQTLTERFASLLMLLAMLTMTVAAPFQMQALDVQVLPTDTKVAFAQRLLALIEERGYSARVLS